MEIETSRNGLNLQLKRVNIGNAFIDSSHTHAQFQRLSRVGGVLYLILITCGIYAEIFVLSDLEVQGDQTATANNILSNEKLFRLGIVAHVVTLLCSSFLIGILYKIFKTTSDILVITLVTFNVVTVAIEGVSILFELETLSILKSKMIAVAFSVDQVNAWAYMPIKMQSLGYDLALLFFGFACCLISVLIHKSNLFSRWIGHLMFLAGVCYISNSFMAFLFPVFRGYLLPFILIPCFIAELSLSINMIVAGSRRSENDQEIGQDNV